MLEHVVLEEIGLSDSKIPETLKNKALTKKIVEIYESIKSDSSLTDINFKEIGPLIYNIASKMKVSIYDKRFIIIKYITCGKIKTDVQLSASFEFLLQNPACDLMSNASDIKNFEKSCGIGVSYTPEDIEKAVELAIEKHKQELLTQKYDFNTGKLLGEAMKQIKFANVTNVKLEIEVQQRTLLGSKLAFQEKSNDLIKPVQAIKEIVKPVQQPVLDYSIQGESLKFHKPGENYTTDGYVVTPLTMKLLEQHLKETGGKIFTRFPPEPNGILHIGHAKAINFNFGYAKINNGQCYLRYDDTNPEKEEEKYFKGIQEMVEWLGFKPYKITYASDNFEQLYLWAIELIRRGKAYVCHQPNEEIKGHNPPPSPWRERPIPESLALFEDMRQGKFEEGQAMLRMKLRMEDGKQDPVAYRIKYTPHHRTSDKWCIYPTYDYTHCLCDSIENITHSLCTKEFQSHRSAYYWLCNALDIYCPVQWEYSRLNFLYTVVSKRKIIRIIECGIVNDWDDPRLFTLTALRRRGVPPEAINLMCARIGVTMAQTVLHPSVLDACIREILNFSAPRTMAIINPLKIIIKNMPPESLKKPLIVPNFPPELIADGNIDTKATHEVAVSNEIWIESTDFENKELAKLEKGYKRLCLDQEVGLKYLNLVIKCESVVQDSNGNIKEIHAICNSLTDSNKPKGFIHWVCNPVPCELRLYDKLFNVESPENNKEAFANKPEAINELKKITSANSVKIVHNACIDRSIAGAKPLDKFQFERNGFFSVDMDSKPNKIVFNRVVTLRDNTQKA